MRGSIGFGAQFIHELRIPMRGYEIRDHLDGARLEVLRIPMRGYETAGKPRSWRDSAVTNPHEGL